RQIGLSIMRNDFKPGDALLSEPELSLQFNVSRPVLREALKMLGAKGLIESRPKTGTRVRPRADWNFLDPDVLSWRYAGGVSAEDVRALFELRRAIEPMAAALAAQRATPAQIGEVPAATAEMEGLSEHGEPVD